MTLTEQHEKCKSKTWDFRNISNLRRPLYYISLLIKTHLAFSEILFLQVIASKNSNRKLLAIKLAKNISTTPIRNMLITQVWSI